MVAYEKTQLIRKQNLLRSTWAVEYANMSFLMDRPIYFVSTTDEQYHKQIRSSATSIQIKLKIRLLQGLVHNRPVL